MEHTFQELSAFLAPGKHIHLIGIGGVSMRPLGLVLKGIGAEITGSDMNASVSTDELERKGIRVAIGHREENVKGADCIIRTAAVHNDNPEIAAARRLGIPVFERAQAWGVIMRNYNNAICVSGTHGKTTTTGMLTHILMQSKKDPTVMMGGYLPLLNAGHRVGNGDTILLESCEYCNSFLNFFPTVAVILNVEADHLDFFKDLQDVERSFRKFAELATDTVIANGDSDHTRETLHGLHYHTFGFGTENEVHPVNVSEDYREFDVICNGETYCHISLSVLGKHNAMNALAACATSWLMGIDGADAAEGLRTFQGAGRRMEYKGNIRDAQIYDDYAHHPDEIRATLEAARSLPHKRLVLVFQPHTYTRTKALFSYFVKELGKADLLIVSEIYAAREQNTVGISSEDICKAIPGAFYGEDLQKTTQLLNANVRPGDLVITMGAGDIFRVGEAILEGC